MARAETETTPDAAEADVADAVHLDTISITATRSPMAAFEYPGMVTVVGREQIDTTMPSTPDDILRWVPNVEFVGGPRRTSEAPSIRGFSGPDVIVTIDGARQNFDSGHDGRFFIDPSLLREVEVLRGAASSLYGSGGTGGVIELRTVRAEDMLKSGQTTGVRITGGYQTANHEPMTSVTAFGRPDENVDVVASMTLRRSGSIRLGDGSKLDQTDDDILAGLAKVGVDLAEHHAVEASFQRFNNEAVEPNDGRAVSGDLVEKDITADTIRLAYRYNDPADSLFDIDATVYYTNFVADELRLDTLGGGPVGELLTRDVETHGFRLDNRSRLMLSEAAGLTITTGAEGYRDEQNGAAGSSVRGGVPNAKADFFGVYGQAELAWTEPFGALPGDVLLVSGLRYDRYGASSDLGADNDDQALSPRVGLSYLPTGWSLLFASYAEAFRAPTINEIYLSGVHFEIPGMGIVNRFIANPDLRPQTTRTVEFGAGLDFRGVVRPGDRVQIKGTHFIVRGKDFIDLEVNQPFPPACSVFIPGDCDGTTRSVNVADARLHGNEIEASYEDNRIRLELGFSDIDGENRNTGEKLGILTPPQMTLHAALKLPEMDSVVGWRMLAADEFDKVNEDDERRAGYAVHDVYFSWRPSSARLPGLEVNFGVQNIFDKAYSRVYTDALEPGRNYTALVSYTLAW